MTLSDRVCGCILGGAIGDAMGGPYENASPPIRLDPDAPSRLSDDTQLTLATCEAIIAAGHADPECIAATFAALFQQRRLVGLGASTFKALEDLAAGGHWALAGARGEQAAGNGSAIRIAPLAFLFDPSEDHARQVIHDVSRITHHSDEAYCGALAVVTAVRSAFTGSWQGGSGLLSRVGSLLPDSAVRDRVRALESDFVDAPLGDLARRFGTSGYVVESVPFAIAAAERLDRIGFRAIIEQVIQAGGDTDSVASIAGQICGTCLGPNALPKDWLERLPGLVQVGKTAQSFATYVEHRLGTSDRE